MSESPCRVENNIMRLALQATETTLGQNGLNAMRRMANLEHHMPQPPTNDHQLAIPGEEVCTVIIDKRPLDV